MSLRNSKPPRQQLWIALPLVLSIAVTLLGLGLRIEHALTFDGPRRGADYAVNLHGVHWMLAHKRPFDFTPEVSSQVGYQPPLWFALGAVIFHFTGHERPIAWLAVIGWLVRQLVLARILREAIPKQRWSALAALSIHALLPISALTDGKLNPEGLHTTLFTLAVYGLWRIEREAHAFGGASKFAGVWFGVFSGLAVLTKATAGVLPLAAAIVFAWQLWTLRSEPDARVKRFELAQAGALAALCWCVVAGWWCGPNLLKYGHPFPHIWNLSKHMSEPLLYRRPLGWIMPFEWKSYLAWPIIFDQHDPRPNFWATSVVGMWTDIYNRGFCRLKGGEYTRHVFGANWGPGYGPEWWVSLRCMALFSQLAWAGLVVSIEATLAVLYVFLSHLRSGGRRGSLVLPLIVGLVTFFVMLFALAYPFDDNVVLNPRYLLPATTPMAACLGIGLAQLPFAPRAKNALHALVLASISVVGVLLLIERFGT